MKIAAIVGSTRKESFNLKLAHFMKDRYAGQFDIDILEIGQLPFYNQDEENTPSAEVVEFKQNVADADAVLWVTPEYNGTITSAMKNAIDWLSRVNQVMIGKPSWIVGASMGALGTVKAQSHLRDILFAPGLSSPILPGNEVLISSIHEKVDEQGYLTDEGTIDFLDTTVENVRPWLEKQAAVRS